MEKFKIYKLQLTVNFVRENSQVYIGKVYYITTDIYNI